MKGKITQVLVPVQQQIIRIFSSFFIPFFAYLATEIRCQEKSKGGLRYEVILAEPTVNQIQLPKVVQNPANKGPSLSAQEIEDKLKAAEERRLVREDTNMSF